MKMQVSISRFARLHVKHFAAALWVVLVMGFFIGVSFSAESVSQSSESVVHSAAWSPDGSMIAVGYGTSRCVPNRPDLYAIEIINLATNQVVHTLPGGECAEVMELDWSPDGTLLASASLDWVGIRIWDVASGQLLIMNQTPGQGNFEVSWRPDGAQVAFTGYGEVVMVFEVAMGEVVDQFAPGTTVDWSPDGSKVLSGSYSRNEIFISDPVSGQVLMTLSGHTAPVHSVAWSPDGTKLASGGEDNTVLVWDATTGTLLLTLQGHTNFVTEVVWSPDSSLLASSSDDGTIRVWDVETGAQVGMIQESRGIFTLAWSPDGTRLAYDAPDGTLEIVPVPQIAAPRETPPKQRLGFIP